jgi:hypothetical protein
MVVFGLRSRILFHQTCDGFRDGGLAAIVGLAAIMIDEDCCTHANQYAQDERYHSFHTFPLLWFQGHDSNVHSPDSKSSFLPLEDPGTTTLRGGCQIKNYSSTLIGGCGIVSTMSGCGISRLSGSCGICCTMSGCGTSSSLVTLFGS